MIDVPESHRDLLDAEVAVLTTLDRRGFPASSAVWFLYADGEVGVSLNSSRRKTRNLRERPECSLFILDREVPYRYLEIRGRARLDPTTATSSRARSARSTRQTSAQSTARVSGG